MSATKTRVALFLLALILIHYNAPILPIALMMSPLVIKTIGNLRTIK